MATKKPPRPVARGEFRCDDLLYVGVTDDVFRRLAWHRQHRSSWEPKMARLEWDVYRTRLEAVRAEAHQIVTLGPLHNKAGAVPHPRPKPLPWPRAFTEDELHQAAIAAHRGTPFLEWIFVQGAAA